VSDKSDHKTRKSAPRRGGAVQLTSKSAIAKTPESYFKKLRRRLGLLKPLISLVNWVSAPKKLEGSRQRSLLVKIRGSYPWIPEGIREAEFGWSKNRDGSVRSNQLFRTRRYFDNACRDLGFSPSRFDVSPTFRALIEDIQDDLERSGARVFGRIDKDVFEKAVAAVEADSEVVRLWIETINSGEGDGLDGYHPVLIGACRRCGEIVQKIVPSDSTSEQMQVWAEVRKRLTLRLGPVGKKGR
jgi:hypothetical protein